MRGAQRGEETDERDEKENGFDFFDNRKKKKHVSHNSQQKMPVLTPTAVRQEFIAARTRLKIGKAILTSLSLSKNQDPVTQDDPHTYMWQFHVFCVLYLIPPINVFYGVVLQCLFVMLRTVMFDYRCFVRYIFMPFVQSKCSWGQ